MRREGAVGALRIELVAERAVAAETGVRIHPALRVHVLGVRKLGENGAFALVARERQKVFGAGGRETPYGTARRSSG